MNFPNHLRITLVDSLSGLPIPDMAVSTRFFALKKNDYYVLAITDHLGSVDLTREWVQHMIILQQTFALMDYSSSLDECLPAIECETLSR